MGIRSSDSKWSRNSLLEGNACWLLSRADSSAPRSVSRLKRKRRGITMQHKHCNECHCGNNYDYDKHGHRPKDCTLGCQGNTAETCGGHWRLQLYSDINECEVGEEGYDNDCHNCNNTKGSHTCSCNRGYKLSSNGKSCIDVNECDGVNGTDYNQECHHCQNAEPGYTCECNDGYEADNSNLEGTCVAVFNVAQLDAIWTFEVRRDACMDVC
ncbi:hypothetical protein CAPTEDRAFT_190050 [Capitella teleta]|uniref:EGF-like domain-containing protein n=1 Tax=Capitella teleta TaxID=283909 RepID=R7V5Z6_CAPTE|nr:hypothetical protein CAPTEDRAFT_190050 [Capitella teleta]|eukprot:ELU14004.1 hypothetical protein CAPTEDRAFT_190050 [Capitella teleta]